ncbi:MAG: hypothetical protein DCC55_36225 [Chloroflexi bacterium]|nr:MAG: hypothetical protein DCC55_36225 [Chloroflexota bacterium]
MADYANAPLPAEVRQQADELLKPNLQTNLSEAHSQTEQAARQRDDDKATEIANAQKATAKINADADQEQRKIVVDNRREVAKQQKEGIEGAYEQVNEFSAAATKEQTAARKEIGDKVKGSEGKARQELEKGEADAAKEKEKKEKEAADKKKELEEESKKESWWSRVGSAIKKAVKAITAAIDTIFTALREAVKTIIEKAKNAAIGLINAARDWVVDKLNKFRDWAKEQVNTYLKDRFPELAERINRGIDAVVDTAIDGVNAVADAAIAGVEALANGLAAALDKVLQVFQTALKAAVQIAGAVLTGDFAEALRVAIQAACEIAGIDPQPIFDFIDRAAAQIMNILKHPREFFNNVMAAVGGGVRSFAKNIKTHLINGLIGWLTGALSEVAITLPTTFDVKGIFSLVMQILGLTYENIKARVIKRFPPAAGVFSAVEKGFAIVKRLVTEGPIALWEMAKESLVNLKEIVLGGIRSFVITTVVKEAITWLLGLLNPAGALVKILKLIYDFVMFLVERFQQIKDFVLSVYNSLAAIASGAIGPAQAAVEDALARSLPVVISLLASLAGLGGIGKTVKEIIGKVATPVNKVIDKVIDKIIAFAKKLLGQGKPGTEGSIGLEDQKKHSQYVKEIKDELKKPAGKDVDSFDKFYRVKSQGAEQLRKQYQPKLKKGIKLAISYGSLEQEKKDRDIDVKIKISPNTTTDSVTLEPGDQPPEGAVAVYRGLHFGTNWDSIRKTKYEDEIRKTFDQIKADGTFSTASYQVALERMGKDNPTSADLESATTVVNAEIEKMKQTHDIDRAFFLEKLANLDKAIAKARGEGNTGEVDRLTGLRTTLADQYEKRFTSKGGRQLPNKFLAALTHYLDDQKSFESELEKRAGGFYGDLPFTKIPFISTSKSGKGAALYAFGKLAGAQKRTTGVVGRVLVYIASLTDLEKAGAMDARKYHDEGKIVLSRRRFGEQEVTFTGSIPPDFLKNFTNATVPPDAPDTVGTRAEGLASSAAGSLGGLKDFTTQ